MQVKGRWLRLKQIYGRNTGHPATYIYIYYIYDKILILVVTVDIILVTMYPCDVHFQFNFFIWCLLWIDLPATTTWWHFGLWSSLVYTRWSVSPEPNQLPRKTKKWSHLHVHQRYFISSYRCNYTWFHCICICLSYPFFIFLSETAAPAHRLTFFFHNWWWITKAWSKRKR